VKGDGESLSSFGELGPIGDDRIDGCIEISRGAPSEEVIEAVTLPGSEYTEASAGIRLAEFPSH